MSRRLLCETCGQGRTTGTQQVLAESEIGEAAEYMRTVIGHARAPQMEQRVMAVNDQPVALPLDAFDCDQCGAAIKPGDKACAETIWLDGRPEPGAWESEYLSVPK